MPEWAVVPVLFLVGVVSGALNVVAGGGSFLTLPVLIFVGLPASVANGTNRVGIWLQNAGAVWGFDRHRVLAWRWAAWAAVPATVGAGLGTWGALVVSDEAFRKTLAFLMVAISLWTLADPLGRGRKGAPEGPPAGPGGEPPGSGATPPDGGGAAAESSVAPPRRSRAGFPPGARRWALAAGFFAVGVYGGFVQAGVGFLILAVTTLGGLDLVRGNAVKVLSILAFTTLSLAIFVQQGKVDWPLGLALAAGSLAGGQLGVRLTVLKGHRWIKAVVTAAVVVFAVKLWFE